MPKLDWLKKSTSPPPGRGTGRDGRFVVNTDKATGGGGNGRPPRKKSQTDITEIIKEGRWRSEWECNRMRWRFFLDSLEGGQRYREAIYGVDHRGFPVRNLLRHKREYPDAQEFPNSATGFGGYAGAMMDETSAMSSNVGPWPGMRGADPYATAYDDDYEMRRSRTPPPNWVGECVEIHLAKIYDQEVHRDGPDDLKAFWADVDGQGTSIDDWMKEVFAPLQLAVGFLDICFDHPEVPIGEKVTTRADELRLGLDRCIGSYILPENIVWWRFAKGTKDYEECLVREFVDPADRKDYAKKKGKDGKEKNQAIDPDGDDEESKNWRRNYVRYRYWTADGSQLYDYEGEEIGPYMPHQFGRVPIRRQISKVCHRDPHVGKSRYEEVAELQRDYYNVDSERILSATLHAHPTLQGPIDMCRSDSTVSFGPQYILPMPKDATTGHYAPWSFVTPSTDPSEALRRDKQDLLDRRDQIACIAKPAGAARTHGSGGGGSTVAQSGVSKQLDHVSGHKLLTSLSKSLAAAERIIAEYALMVLRNGVLTDDDRASIKVGYPAKFELFGPGEQIDNLTKLQLTFTGCGQAPKTELAIYEDIVRQTVLGLTDEEYEELDDELEEMVQAKATLKQQRGSLEVAMITSKAEAMENGGSTEGESGTDPQGVSAATAVTGGFDGAM